MIPYEKNGGRGGVKDDFVLSFASKYCCAPTYCCHFSLKQMMERLRDLFRNIRVYELCPPPGQTKLVPSPARSLFPHLHEVCSLTCTKLVPSPVDHRRAGSRLASSSSYGKVSMIQVRHTKRMRPRVYPFTTQACLVCCYIRCWQRWS